MKLFCFFLLFPLFIQAQDHSFPFSHITYDDLNATSYSIDTTAVAVLLDEFGEAWINNDLKLQFVYHYKMKILKKNGLDEANVAIPLLKLSFEQEQLLDVRAASYNISTHGIDQQEIEKKNIYTESRNEFVTVKHFAIPNVKVGSIIEVKYTVESPYLFNFKRWRFQGVYPKIRSEFWATIPANYVYNISLKGYLPLASNTSELIKDGFTPSGGNKSDCSRLKFVMKDIPAFVEEDYMTARTNFESAIEFELSEIKRFDGYVDKITKEWKDVEHELRMERRFGVQLRRGEDIMDETIKGLLQMTTDPLAKAQKIYTFIQDRFTWNGEFSKYCENGIKKAFENRTGNVGDINLSLIAALRNAGLQADPLILSTRDNGIVTELFPVLSGFNYVVAKLAIANRVYLLDATDKLLPFNMLPFRCLNGKGRVIGDKKTAWYEVLPTEKNKMTSYVDVKLDAEGNLSGVIKNTYLGYAALNKRREILRHASEQQYGQQLRQNMDADIVNLEIKSLHEINSPLIELIEIQKVFDRVNPHAPFLVNPFLIQKWEHNPFKSSERLYPVDFGVQLDERITITISYPEGVEVLQIPDAVALALPQNEGKYLLSAQISTNRISISSWLTINNTYFTSKEYHFLKELFNRIVQAQNSDIILKFK